MIFADANPFVTLFNRVLIEILRVAPTGEEFHFLRTHPEALIQRLEESTAGDVRLELLEYTRLLEVISSPWWQRLNSTDQNWYVSETVNLNFEDTIRYWQVPHVYEKLHRAAIEGRMSAVAFNLGRSGCPRSCCGRA